MLLKSMLYRRACAHGVFCTHEETGARTRSPLCVTLYERWWLRKRPHLRAVPSAPNDAEPAS